MYTDIKPGQRPAPLGTKKCTTCQRLGDCGGTIDKCANCWEVERRLKRYLQSAVGLAFVLNTLSEVLEMEKK